MEKNLQAFFILLMTLVFSCDTNPETKQDNNYGGSTHLLQNEKGESAIRTDTTKKEVSKEETINWILSKLNSYSRELNMSTKSGHSEVRQYAYKFKIVDNRLVCDSKQDDNKPSAIIINKHEEVLITDILSIDFWDFHNDNSKAGKAGNSIGLKCVANSILEKISYPYQQDMSEGHESVLWCGFRCNAESGLQQRLTNAFHHLKEIIKKEGQAF